MTKPEVIDIATARLPAHNRPRKRGGGPGGPSDMEQRVANLEQVTADMRVTLARIDERTESIEKHGATKADLSGVETSVKSAEATMIKWFVCTAVALAGVAFAAAALI